MKYLRSAIAGCAVLFANYPTVAQLQLEVAFPNLLFTRPVDLQHAGDGSNRLFVLEQAGIIRVFENDRNAAATNIFLDIRDRVNDSGNEEGLLGLAFHPDYSSNGFFFVYYSASSPRRSVVARYQVDANNPNLADINSRFVILEISQPYVNHNGGQLAFKPGEPHNLYIGLGDGGSGGDPQNHGQNLTTLLGAFLRIDVDNPANERNYGIPSDNPFAGNTSGWREEIYAYGVRNPWRFSFDPVTGWLWAGDVGQNAVEEIDIIESGKNYGWRIMEGSRCYNPSSGCNMNGLTLPVWDYSHALGSSITGGHVYRGSDVPELTGKYIYGDFGSGRIWALTYDGQNPAVNQELMNTSLLIAAFGVDAAHELYLCAFDGKIYRFQPTTTAVAERSELPVHFGLSQNYPNPFNPQTRIDFTIAQAAEIELNVHDLNGKLIRSLYRGMVTPGRHSLLWDGTDADGRSQPAGIYFYRLRSSDGNSFTRRMVLVK